MKPRKTWLHAAVRAHQAKTLDQLQRARHAKDELSEAERCRDRASQRLESLGEAWAHQRRAAPASQAIDALYSRFHGFLSGESVQAERTEQACRDLVDAAVAELQQSHAVQRTLEKAARRKVVQQRRDAAAAEFQTNAEAWLLGRLAGRSAVHQEAGIDSAEFAASRYGRDRSLEGMK